MASVPSEIWTEHLLFEYEYRALPLHRRAW
jgi:hypothetical protein